MVLYVALFAWAKWGTRTGASGFRAVWRGEGWGWAAGAEISRLEPTSSAVTQMLGMTSGWCVFVWSVEGAGQWVSARTIMNPAAEQRPPTDKDDTTK